MKYADLFFLQTNCSSAVRRLSRVFYYEEHAKRIQHTVTQYFMTQRIKPDQEKYAGKVTVLHQMLIAAMKCKQTANLDNVETLRVLLKKFETLNFGSHGK